MRKQLRISGLGCALVFAPTPAVLAKTVQPATDHQRIEAREVTALIGPARHKQVRPMSEIWFYPDQRQLEFDRNGRLDRWSKP